MNGRFRTFAAIVAVAMLTGRLHAQVTASEQQDILILHNQTRCSVGASVAMPPLTWDPTLAQVAQNWANQCTLSHNANRNTDYAALGGSGQVGENIAWGTASAYSARDLTALWIAERPYWDYNTNTCANGQVCGHYTQIVWAGTTRVGCGEAICGTNRYLVCDYAPAGNFVGQRPYTIATGSNTACTVGAVRSDFSHDGKTDIVLRNYATGQDAVWIMNGTSLSSIADLPALANSSWHIEGTADFNGDGYSDILLRNYTTGQNAVWLMNQTTLASIVDLPALVNVAYHFVGTGDFNFDGKPDIILRNSITGQNAVWLMNGTTLSAVVDLPALTDMNWHIESSGDFNGDGMYDIVLRNYATGQNALWIMSGTNLSSIVDLPALTNTAYRLTGVGDFTGEGYPDIVWRNSTTGQNALWIMNGTSLASVTDLPALPNTNYEIDGPR